MLRPMRAIFQALYMPGVIAPLPAIEGLWGDVKMTTGEAGTVIRSIVVVKPFESLPGLAGQLGDTGQTPGSRDRAVDIHSAAIVTPFHNSCVTHLSERDQG